MRDLLQRRMMTLRSRAIIRAWEYRQRNHAKGTWYRLRRLLADASSAYVLTEQAARDLLSEGHPSEALGERIEPPKVILWLTAERIQTIGGKRQIPVRLTAEFLAARCIALVRFGEEER